MLLFLAIHHRACLYRETGVDCCRHEISENRGEGSTLTLNPKFISIPGPHLYELIATSARRKPLFLEPARSQYR